MKTKQLAEALALAVILPSFAASAPVVDFDNASAKPASFDAGLTAGFQALGKRVSAEKAAYTLPRYPVDAFKAEPACSMVDAYYLRAFRLDEAVSALQPCFAALSKRYDVAISPAKGLVALSQGGSTEGIQVQVTGVTFIGNPALFNLDYALKLRHGRLLGFPAAVSRGVSVLKDMAAAPAVPAWVDASTLYVEPHQTTMANGSLRVVLFDKNDDQVEFDAPVAGHLDAAQATVDFTKADDEEVGPLPVGAVQASSVGALGRLVSNVSVPSSLDAATRTAVAALFRSLGSR